VISRLLAQAEHDGESVLAVEPATEFAAGASGYRRGKALTAL